jgi:hypothetical protein
MYHVVIEFWRQKELELATNDDNASLYFKIDGNIKGILNKKFDVNIHYTKIETATKSEIYKYALTRSIYKLHILRSPAKRASFVFDEAVTEHDARVLWNTFIKQGWKVLEINEVNTACIDIYNLANTTTYNMSGYGNNMWNSSNLNLGGSCISPGAIQVNDSINNLIINTDNVIPIHPDVEESSVILTMTEESKKEIYEAIEASLTDAHIVVNAALKGSILDELGTIERSTFIYKS